MACFKSSFSWFLSALLRGTGFWNTKYKNWLLDLSGLPQCLTCYLPQGEGQARQKCLQKTYQSISWNIILQHCPRCPQGLLGSEGIAFELVWAHYLLILWKSKVTQDFFKFSGRLCSLGHLRLKAVFPLNFSLWPTCCPHLLLPSHDASSTMENSAPG